MFARIATFDWTDLDGLERVTRWANEHGADVVDWRFAGYAGGIALLDRDAKRVTEIQFFNTEPDAQHADEVLDRGLPDEVPVEIRDILAQSRRTSRGVVEILFADGQLAELAHDRSNAPA